MTNKINPVDLDKLDALPYIGRRFSVDEHTVTYSMAFPLDEMGGTEEDQIEFAKCGGLPFWTPIDALYSVGLRRVGHLYRENFDYFVTAFANIWVWYFTGRDRLAERLEEERRETSLRYSLRTRVSNQEDEK